MAKELLVPRLPQLPDMLPAEKQVTDVLDRIAERVYSSGPAKVLESLRQRAPTFPERKIPTPLGTLIAPRLSLPEVSAPKMQEREKAMVKAAVGVDVSRIVGVVPIVGDALGSFIQDFFIANIYDTLTPEEAHSFSRINKISPSSTLAMMQLWVERRRNGKV